MGLLDEKQGSPDAAKLNDSLVQNSMFSIVNMSTKSILTGDSVDLVDEFLKPKDTEPLEETKLKRIQRGFSAKRYLNNLTKYWDQNVLDTFISDGKIKNVEKKKDKLLKRKIEDDLTHWPQAYRIDQNWAYSAIDMKSYKFLKSNEFNPNYLSSRKADFKGEKQYSRLDSYNSLENVNDLESPLKRIKNDPIKIYNQNQEEVSYKMLDPVEKERVLSELLFHSAMNNIIKMVRYFFKFFHNFHQFYQFFV